MQDMGHLQVCRDFVEEHLRKAYEYSDSVVIASITSRITASRKIPQWWEFEVDGIIIKHTKGLFKALLGREFKPALSSNLRMPEEASERPARPAAPAAPAAPVQQGARRNSGGQTVHQTRQEDVGYMRALVADRLITFAGVG